MDNTKAVIEHFAQRATTFDKDGWTQNDVILNTILNGIGQIPSEKLNILDYGAGTGDVSKYILKHISNSVNIVALDISKEMLERIQDYRIKTVVSSVEKTPFKQGQFDLIISRQCLHYVSDLKKTILEIKRILKRKGRFILTQFVPCESNSRFYWELLTRIRQPLRVHYFSESDWINCFTKYGFTVLSVEHFFIRNSVKKWSQQYHLRNTAQEKEYISMLLNAPEEYKKDYNVIVKNNCDIESTTFGVTIVFEL